MKALIVDDESHIVKILLHYLGKNSKIEILSTAGTVKEAVEKIKIHKPNTLFLDIELEDGLSFEILKQIPPYDYKVVFITAHAHYAIQAIRFSAFDYLLKPINPIELNEVVERLLKEEQKNSIEARLLALEENLKNQNKPSRLVLKTADKYILVNQEDVIRLEADNTYTSIYTSDKKEIIVSQSIKHFEELLPCNQFIRTHRSHIINIHQVCEYIKSDGGYIRMNNGDDVPLAGTHKAQFLEMLQA